MTPQFDLIVIGGGSGGTRCARIAASHGARVAIIEEARWGGTCVNVGCVPKKLMVQAAEYGAAAQDAHGFGWTGMTPQHDWGALIAAKDSEILRLNRIYRRLLDDAGVETIEAAARFAGPRTVRAGERELCADRVVIATGGEPVWPEIEGARLGIVSDAAFELPALPKRVTLVGGGYIGVEFAGIFRGLGAEVDHLYRQRLPLRGFDHDIREALAEAMAHAGIRAHPSVKLHSVTEQDGCKRLTLSDGRHFDSDLVFFAIGRQPRTAALACAAAGVALAPNGAVVVNDRHETSAAGIYAIGDVSNRLNLTPVALAEGHILADRLFGPGTRDWSFQPVPTAVFSTPPIGVCGLTEEAAAERGPVDVYIARFTPARHMLSGRPRRSLLKLVVDAASDRVVGAHCLSDDAAEMMQGIGIAMNAGATKRDFDRTIGIHPTIAEEWVTMRVRTRQAGLAAAAD